MVSSDRYLARPSSASSWINFEQCDSGIAHIELASDHVGNQTGTVFAQEIDLAPARVMVVSMSAVACSRCSTMAACSGRFGAAIEMAAC